MGKPLRILCVASNKEHVYILTSAIRFNSKGDEEGGKLYALIRSEQYPAQISNATWTLVDTLSPTSRDNTLQPTMQCSVDSKGIFVVSDGTIRLIHASSNSTSSSNGWTAMAASVPNEDNLKTWRIFWPEDKTGKQTETVVSFPRPMDDQHPQTIPYLDTIAFDSTWHMDEKTRQHHRIGNFSGFVAHVEYGDGQLFVINKLNPPFRTGNSTVDTYNQTLAHYPFPVSETGAAAPLPITSLPWNTPGCLESRIYRSPITAVANGKLYLLCDSKVLDTHNMYIFDSKSNQTQSHSFNIRIDAWSSMTVVYGSASRAEPRFAIVTSLDITHAIDLSSMESVQISDTIFVSENLKKPNPPPSECAESCSMGKQIMKLIIGLVSAFVVLVLICVVFWCRRRKNRKLRAAVSRDQNAAAHESIE
ncbi:hypothetical protein BG004_007944 [Podila humilis]|nr:hypothetical protein BG004_007944 [Podila humilis]